MLPSHLLTFFVYEFSLKLSLIFYDYHLMNTKSYGYKEDYSVKAKEMDYTALGDFYKFIKANYSYNLHNTSSVSSDREILLKLTRIVQGINKYQIFQINIIIS